MHELVVPDLPAGSDVETDEALPIEAVAGPVAAIIIVGRRAHRQIDVAELLVGAHRCPDVGVAGFLPGFLLPGFGTGLLALRHRVESPEQLAVRDVESPDIADGRRPLAPPVEHGGADHDDIAYDHRRRGHGVEMRRDGAPQAGVEIDTSVGAEVRDGLSGSGIERDHLCKSRQDHDPLVVAIAPIGEAAMGPAEVGGRPEPILIDLGVEHPSGFAGRGIDGRDLRQRGRGVEHAADHQRRRFIDKAGADLRFGLPDRRVRRLPAPDHVQVPGVVAVDLCQRRIARRGVGAGIGRPFALRHGFRRFRQRAGDGLSFERSGQQRQNGTNHHGASDHVVLLALITQGHALLAKQY